MAGKSLRAYFQASSSMSAEVGENAIDVALKVAAALTAVGADYFLGGSLASSLQGEPRATNDIDFVIALPAGKIGALRDALGTDFEVDTDMLRDAVLHARSSNAFYLPQVTKIDFFGRGHEPFDDSEFSRRRPVVVSASGASIVVKSAEDTVLRKLLCSAKEGVVSEKQWRDVVSVLRISGEAMDDAYLTSWASRLDIDELLQAARKARSPELLNR
ncbi:MAG: nucleotidyl transferase AbiEii/AbiGii toxin family protein [Pseudomonadota bacterium]